MTRPGIEPRSPGKLENTLLIMTKARLKEKLATFVEGYSKALFSIANNEV